MTWVAVGLQIGLVHHVQAVTVAQGVPTAVVRIMRGAHAVDVVPLHQQDVLFHGLHAHRVAQAGMGLVPVDALELDGAAVEEELLVPQHHLAEPHLQALHLADLGRPCP